MNPELQRLLWLDVTGSRVGAVKASAPIPAQASTAPTP